MSCSHPRCHGEIGRGRLLCTPHWIQLPDDVKARVRQRIGERNFEAARLVLHDFYSALYQMRERFHGDNDAF